MEHLLAVLGDNREQLESILARTLAQMGKVISLDKDKVRDDNGKTENWAQATMVSLSVATSKDYRQKALFQETKKLFQDLVPTDGTSTKVNWTGGAWSPKEWSN